MCDTGIALLSAIALALGVYICRPEQSTLPCTVCPKAAEVRSPLLSEPLCAVDQAATAPHNKQPGASEIGILLNTVSGRLDEVKPTLRRLVKSDAKFRPRLIYVAIDEKQRLFKWLQAMPLAVQRLCGALVPGCRRESVAVLEATALHLQKISDGVPTLVERVQMRSCTGLQLARHAFGCPHPWLLGVLSPRCWFPFFDKNTVSYLYGIARLLACVRYVVHIDPDVSLVRHPPALLSGRETRTKAGRHGSWVQRAVRLLRANPHTYAILPTRDRSRRPECAVRAAAADNSSGAAGDAMRVECVCSGATPSGRWLGRSRAHLLRLPEAEPKSARTNESGYEVGTTGDAGRAAHAASTMSSGGAGKFVSSFVCAETVVGAHGEHFSFQAFALDAERFMHALWPLPIRWASADLRRAGGPLGHVEGLIERAHSHTRARPLFMHAADLGVRKR